MSDPAPFHDAPPQDTETTTEAVSSSQRHTRIVAVANQKGGVGKTTTVINLAACLAELGQTVLVVDLDPQANATSGLGLAKEEGISMYPAMIGETPANDMRRATDYENVHIIPSELDMASSEIEVARMDNYLQCVDAALRSVAETDTYDFMLLDCPPSLGILTMNALAAADSVLVPMQCEYYALEGLSVISKLIHQLRDSGANPRLEVEGIVMTMFDARTNLSSDVVCEVNKHFPEKIYNTVIPRNIRLSEAPSFGKPIITYAPQSPGAVAYSLFARDFLERRGITLADDTPETQRPPRIPIFRVKTIDDSEKSA